MTTNFVAASVHINQSIQQINRHQKVDRMINVCMSNEKMVNSCASSVPVGNLEPEKRVPTTPFKVTVPALHQLRLCCMR